MRTETEYSGVKVTSNRSGLCALEEALTKEVRPAPLHSVKVGGSEMIASAAKVPPVKSSGEEQALQHPSIISATILRLRLISPLVREVIPGIRPGSIYL
jgi:hypothetical protein